MKKEIVYVCEHCGSEFESEELCREHERQCHLRKEAVRAVLSHTLDDRFVFSVSTIKSCQLEATQEYEEVYGYDVDCDYFAIVSKDTSEEHIKELKEKLLKKATEAVKEYRDEQSQYYEDLLKELKAVEGKEKELTEKRLNELFSEASIVHFNGRDFDITDVDDEKAWLYDSTWEEGVTIIYSDFLRNVPGDLTFYKKEKIYTIEEEK